jgi:hypothetical protein
MPGAAAQPYAHSAPATLACLCLSCGVGGSALPDRFLGDGLGFAVFTDQVELASTVMVIARQCSLAGHMMLAQLVRSHGFLVQPC